MGANLVPIVRNLSIHGEFFEEDSHSPKSVFRFPYIEALAESSGGIWRATRS